jgi:16S rRNA U516 pseudouridylate synthase RsuA-like enzyme
MSDGKLLFITDSTHHQHHIMKDDLRIEKKYLISLLVNEQLYEKIDETK